jgi:SpoVK/Ycf46/Vps4 family AAA+-type ATPase
VAAMLQTLLDSKEMKGVFIIGAANDPGEMNEAMLRNGRFGLRVACLPPQNTKEKIKVFRAVFAQVNSLRGETVPYEIIEFIVNSEKLSGASGADYYELIRRTAIKWRTKKVPKLWELHL